MSVSDCGGQKARVSVCESLFLFGKLGRVCRSSVCAAMSFCMGHGGSSAEICACLTESLTLKDTALSTRLARTYLLSDLLANASAHAPHAWTFRQHIEKGLPFIFDRWEAGPTDIRGSAKRRGRGYLSVHSAVSVLGGF